MGVISDPRATTAADPTTVQSTSMTRLMAGLLATLPALPIFAIVATVTFYVSTAGTPNNTLLYGLLVAIAAWLIVGSVAATFNSAPRANPGVYSELVARRHALEIDLESGRTRLDVLPTGTGTGGSASQADAYERASLIELERHVHILAGDFEPSAAADNPPSPAHVSGATGTRLSSRVPSGEWDLSGEEVRDVKDRAVENAVTDREDKS